MNTDENRTLPHGSDQDAPPLNRRHSESIEAIAQELELPVDDVAPRYEAVLRELMAEAQIGDYLPILVAKRVRAQYRRSGSTR